MVQLSHLYMTMGKTETLTLWTFVGKVMSLLFNMLFRFVIAFLPTSKFNLIAAVTVHSDFGAQENLSLFPFFSSICQEVMVSDAMIFIFLMLGFKLAFSLSSFSFIKVKEPL